MPSTNIIRSNNEKKSQDEEENKMWMHTRFVCSDISIGIFEGESNSSIQYNLKVVT